MTNEIPEAAASGAIARCYADIRHQLGVPLVNLIWRRLAAIGALESCWQRVRDELPTITAQAAALNGRARQLIAGLPSSGGALQGPGVPGSILVSYERGNSINLAMVKRLLGAPAMPFEDGQLPQAPASVPPVPEFAALPAGARAAIDLLARVGPAGQTDIRPTLWIHLAAAPGVIEAVASHLPPVLGCASFRMAHAELTAIDPDGVAGEIATGPVLGILQAFHLRIAEMLLIGLYLEHTLSMPAENHP
jgi:hypothetical protein